MKDMFIVTLLPGIACKFCCAQNRTRGGDGSGTVTFGVTCISYYTTDCKRYVEMRSGDCLGVVYFEQRSRYTNKMHLV